MAMMVVLETLSPTERAVFVLREVFDVSYDEIAAAVNKSSAAVRQVLHRARAHVDSRRPRMTVSPHEARAALKSFQRLNGEIDGIMTIRAEDARITCIYVRNPEKLRRLDVAVPLASA